MCPYHRWGDDFDFVELDRAMDWIYKFYRRATGYRPIMKEKYGTVRYEFAHMWIDTNEQVVVFCEILYRAIHKFPEVAAEIVTDASVDFEVPFYTAYFKGVCWGQCQSEWKSGCKNKHYTEEFKRDEPFFYI